MQCAYLKGRRILLLRRFQDGSAEVAQGAEIKKLCAAVAAQITTTGAAPQPAKERGANGRIKVQPRSPLNAMANELVQQPNLIFCLAAELGFDRQLAQEVRDEVLAEYSELGQTQIRRGTKRPPKPLNARDQQIAGMLSEGCTPDQVAAATGLSKSGAVCAVRRISARMSAIPGKGVIDEARLNRDAEPPRPEPQPLFFKPEPPKPKLPKLHPRTQELCARIDQQLKQIWSAHRLAVAA